MNAAMTLRWARRRAGLTQRELAVRTGIAQPSIARIESGRTMPRVDTLDALVEACGLSLAAVPREGVGLDPTLVRRNLALTPTHRARKAHDGAAALEQIGRARAVP